MNAPQKNDEPQPTVEQEDFARNGDGTLLDGLRKKREGISKDRTMDLDIPGYDGELAVRYGIVPWDELKVIGEKAQESRARRKELMAHADTLIRACRTILLKNQTTGEMQPANEIIKEYKDGEPVRFDERLAEMFKLDTKSARETLFAVFANDLAVTAQHNELGAWMQSSNNQDSQDF